MEATITTGILLSMFTSLVYADVKSTVGKFIKQIQKVLKLFII